MRLRKVGVSGEVTTMAEICVAMSQSRLLKFLLLLGILILGVSGQDTVIIEATPDMETYAVEDNLTLNCTLNPAPTDTSITVTYLWECSDCFADGLTTPTVNRILTVMDNSTIDCSVDVGGNVTMADMPFDLQITRVPPPNVTFQPSSPIQDMVGSLLTVECRVDTVPGVSSSSVMISWTAPGGVGSIMNDSRVTISPTTSNGNVFTSSLQFTYLMEGDEGTYTCNWMILQSSGSEIVELQLTIPTPTVSVTAPSNQTVGQSLTLQCEVTAVRGITSRVDIVWSSGGMELNRTNGTTPMGNPPVYTDSYTISLLSTDDEGRAIQCEVVINASPPVMANDTITLDVTVPTPTVNVTAPDNQTVGQSLTLQCEVTAVRGITSRVDIVWSNSNGGGILRTANDVSSTTINNSLVYTDSYNISQLNTTDEGRMIQCQVVINTDPLVIASESITLDVTVPTPTVTISPPGPIQGAMVGSPQDINCTVSTVSGVESSSVMINWTRPDGSIIATNSITTTTVGSIIDDGNNMYTRSLQFTYLMEGDEGTYTCNVTILDTSESQSVELESLTIPPPTVSVTAPINQTVGQSLTLQCEVTTVRGITSRVDIVWSSGGVELNRTNGSTPMGNPPVYTDSYTIPLLRTTDEGREIQCEVVINASPSVMASDNTILNVTVPIPTVNVTVPDNQTVGQSLTLQCNVTTVRGITSRVDIVWSSGGMELNRTNGTSSTTMDNSLVYTDSYTISQLNTTDEGRVIECEVVINANPPVMASESIAVDVTVPTPAVTISPSGPIQNAAVGSPGGINCTVSTVSGVESSSVMISWMGPDGSITATNGRVSLGSFTDDGNNMYTMNLRFTYLMEGDEGNYTCSVTILDATESQSVELESLTIPTPDVAVTPTTGHILGQPLTLQCEVTAVRGITSRVDIVWRDGSMELNRTNGTTPMGNPPVYTDSYTISLLSTTDDGRVIECEVVINASPPVMANNNVTLDVMAPPVTVTTTISNNQVIVGNREVVTCTVSGAVGVNLGSVMIIWIGPGGAITNDSRVTISPTTSSGNNFLSTLRFEFLMEGDDGIYTCNVTILDTTVSVISDLTGLIIPTPDLSLNHVNPPILSDQLTLECSATVVRGITSTLDFMWIRIDDDSEMMVQNVTRANTTGDSLVYTDIYTTPMALMESDIGVVYVCMITLNAEQQPITNELNITLDTSIIPTDVTIMTPSQDVGQSLTLQCDLTTVRGIVSRVDIIWRNTSGVLDRMNNVTANIMNDSVVYSHNYTIQLTTADHGRDIQCEVFINIPDTPVSDNDVVTLDVVVPPPTVTISSSGPIQEAMVGSLQVFTCTVSTVSGVESSSVMISWMGPGGVITNDSRVTISPTTSRGNTYTNSLQFTYLMEGDEGNYTCNVMILDTSGSESVELISLLIPTPTVIVLAQANQTVGLSETLQCVAFSVGGITSQVDFVWSSRGVELNRTNNVTLIVDNFTYINSYTISQLSTSDNGRVFQCEVVINASPSVMASDSATLNVTVPQPSVMITQSNEVSVSGQDQILTCTVTVVEGISSSLVIVQWNGGNSLSESPRVTVSGQTNNGLQYTRMITFSPSLTDDSGEYTCSVSVTGFDEADNSNSVMISVEVPIVELELTPLEISDGVGDVDISFTCAAAVEEDVMFDDYKFNWLHNDESVDQPDDRINITTTTELMDPESTLYISSNDTMAEDSGTYLCQFSITILNRDNFTYANSSTVMLTEIREPLEPDVTGPPVTTPFSAVVSWIVRSIVNDTETYTVLYGTDMNTLSMRSMEVEGNTDLSTINEMFSVNITGLMPFTKYYYIVSAENTVGITNTSIFNFTTDETAPDIAPPNFMNTNVTATNATFQWATIPLPEANGMIRNYTITCTSNSLPSRTDTFSDTMGTITELAPFTNYSCRILATTVLPGPMSDPVNIRTLESAPNPPVITSLVNISSSTVRVTWTRPTMPNGIITVYYIEYSNESDGSFGDPVERSVPYNGEQTQSYNITGLYPYQRVRVVVIAVNGAGRSDPSNQEIGRSSEAAPGVVLVIRIELSMVTWEIPSEPNGIITGYEVINYNVTSGDELERSNRLSNTTTEYTIPNLMDGVPYNVVVVAFTSAGEGAENDRETFFVNELSPAVPVDSSTVEIMQLSDTSLRMTWTGLSLVEARGFPEYNATLISLSTNNRRKRQSPSNILTIITNNTFAVFENLTSGGSYSPVLGVRSSGADNQMFNVSDPIPIVSVTPSSSPSPTPSPTPSSTPTQTRTPPPEEGEDDGNNVGAIVGGVIGGIIVVAIIVIIVIIIARRFRNTRTYTVVKTDSSAAYVNRRVVSPSDSETGQQDDIVLQTIDPKIEQRREPIPLKNFSEHVANMHKDRDLGFEEEYSTISTEALASYDASQLSANIIKNRYANIFPYDFSRVKISQVDLKDDDTDYINATTIDGYNRTNAYIAAQGPLPETVKDFWQMVWDQKAPIIVMLTKVIEADVQKCEQYWPDKVGESIQPKPSLTITLTQVQHFADYELRSMTVTMASDKEKDDTVVPLEVKQFFFTSWPDHGVPQFATALISFIKRVRQSQPKDGKAPLIVHCSAGVGRTGTYITLDTMLERMQDVDSVTVYDCVRNLRARRVFMVQTQAQYIFIHDALEELITCGDTSFNVQSMRVKVNRMGKVNPETEKTGFQEQFELLKKVSRKPSIANDCADSQQAVNKPKNRFGTIVPYDGTRVILKTVSAIPGSNYINASRIDGYKERNAFIATQCPLDSTIGEFWRMIWENKSAVIVLLCDPKHDEKDFTQFWPEENEEHGPVKVTQKSKEEKNGYLAYKFSVMGPATTVGVEPELLQVTMLHFTTWPNKEKPTNNTGLLALIKDALEVQRNTGNRAMTVVCSDGCGRSGTFMAIYYTIERLKVEGIVDIFQAIKNSRLHRVDLVSNLEQYESCHEVVLEFLDEFEAYANFK